MKALVTGGNGFLGSAIVRLLVDRGDDVSILCRSGSAVAPDPPLSPLVKGGGSAAHSAFRTSHFQADIRDAMAVRKACQGMDVVFHVAAKAGVWGPRREYQSINVEGTRNVIDACRDAGVGRLVYTSSPSVVFGRDDLCGVDESVPYAEKYLAPYPQTKARAEQLVLAATSSSLATVALRPHLIWGPGDPHLIPRVIDRARKGRLRQVGNGTNLVDITYIDNAAEAHVLAAVALSPNAPSAGKAYFISQGEPVNLWSWLNDLLGALEIPTVRRRIPLGTAYALGAGLEFTYGLIGWQAEPPMTRFVANQLAKSHYFDISAAKRDLRYMPRVSIGEGMARTLDWLRRFPAP